MKFLKTLGLAAALSLSAVSAQALTLSAGTGGTNSNDGIMFDLVIGDSFDVTITDFGLDMESGASPIDLYYRTGTHVGNEGSLAGWTLAGTDNIVGAGENAITAWDSPDITLAGGGTYAIFIDTRDAPNLAYYNGSGLGNVVASDGFLSMLEGTGISSPVGGGTNVPRYFSGNINYTVAPVPLPASLPLFLTALLGLGFWRRRQNAA